MNNENDFVLTEEGYWVPKNIVASERMPSELGKKLLRKGGWFVRNTYHFDKKEEGSFWYVIKDTFGGMEELSSKTRQKVRKSLKTYDFKIIDLGILKEFGLDIENRAHARFAVKANEMSQEEFDQRLINEQNEGGYEYWGVFKKDGGEMVGFAIVKVNYGYCFYNYSRMVPECLGNTFPFYGLYYARNQYYLEEKGLKFVSDGSRSITEHSNIQPFLMEVFKFRKAYCDLQVVYKWWMQPIISLLYPFRKWMPHKVQSVLRLEAMHRGKY